jgi:hypothetical protein
MVIEDVGRRILRLRNFPESRVVENVVAVLVVRVLVGWRKELKCERTDIFIKAKNLCVLPVPFLLVQSLMALKPACLSDYSLHSLTLTFPFVGTWLGYGGSTCINHSLIL